MYILSVYPGGHDANVSLYKDYHRLASVAQERMTRIKGDGTFFPHQAVEECLKSAAIDRSQIDVLCLSYSNFPYEFLASKNPIIRLIRKAFRSKKKRGIHKVYLPNKQKEINCKSGRIKVAKTEDLVKTKAYVRHFWGKHQPKVFFYEHHFSHALDALSQTGWNDGLVYTSDGYGDGKSYSCRLLKDGQLIDIFGSQQEVLDFSPVPFEEGKNNPVFRSMELGFSSLALVYAYFTDALGFKGNRHEGKVLGLAAFGKPLFKEELKSWYSIDEAGRIYLKPEYEDDACEARIKELAATHKREDVAASLQQAVEEVMLEALSLLVEKHQPKNIALAGGLFANVLLNQRIIDKFKFEQIFIYPAMGDAGQSAGGVLAYLLERDGLDHWLKQREQLKDVYFGYDYDAEIEEAFSEVGAKRLAEEGSVAEQAAKLIQQGKICGLYQGRMEYGPRALGNRSILASPSDRQINDWLNKRLSRTEFMPFAPVVRAERVRDVFELPVASEYAARFMTITCAVKKEWHDKIPAVVHVDGTARPQVIERDANPLYYDILKHYEERSGIPVLINTSFNAHEEPIINKPQEAARALKDGRVDYVITPKGIYQI